MPKSARAYWLLVVLLVGIAFFLRAHRIQALPPFNDESLHTRRAEIVWSFEDPVVSFTVGKVLTYYWYGLFDAARLDAIWVNRTVTALFALQGLALTYAITKRLAGAWAGVLAVYLLTFSPFMVFFERMALTDPIASVMGLWTIWASLHLLKRPQEWEWGLLTGVFIWLTFLGKLTAMPVALVPLLAIVVLQEGNWRDKWRQYRASLIACYGAAAALITPFALWVVYREVSGQRVNVVDAHLINTSSPLETVINNLRHLWEAHWVFHSPVLVIIGLGGVIWAVYHFPRVMGFMLGCAALAYTIPILGGSNVYTRYLLLGVPMTIAVVAVSWVKLTEAMIAQYPQWRQYQWAGTWVLATGWIFLFAQPFILNGWNDPRQNAYPARDEWEYFANFGAGYGLVEAAREMPLLEPSTVSGRVPVIGLVGSCHQIRLYLDETGIVWLECPFFGWQGEFMGEVADLVDQRATEESVLYLLVEPDLTFTDLSQLRVRHEVIGRFPRPFDGMMVELWRVLKPES